MYNTILPKIKSSPASVTGGLKELFLLVLLQNSGHMAIRNVNSLVVFLQGSGIFPDHRQCC